ncbi:MFS transporter, DHA2 family, glioxin efflux transporter, partial [Lecanoromycetidae sp. Uapishka_2]
MAESTHVTEPEEATEINMSTSTPPPANTETMAEKLPPSLSSEPEELSKVPTNKLEKHETEPEYPSLRRLIPSVAAIYMAFFLVALDRTIIATAIPQITDDFHSLGDIGWYGSAYMLTGCGFQLLMGRVYTFYNSKKVFISSIVVFEIGSAICGAAPNSVVFIIGRAIAGSGSSGIFSGAIVIIMNLVPLHKRPVLQSLVGAIFGIASVAGPLLGGVFTTKVSWRWCFYINLPVGGVAIATMILILHTAEPKAADTPWREQVKKLDPIGTIFFFSSVVCLLLALQWGGSTYSWNDGRIIALLVLFILLTSGFVFIQVWKPDTATVPPRIIKNRNIIGAMWAQLLRGSSMMTLVYYLPTWFQAIKGVSAFQSGIDTLPLIFGLVVASIIAGALVQRIGYYLPFMYASSVVMSIGAGLMTTFAPNTGHEKWIGYQAIVGLGLGLGMQQGSLAAQACLPRIDAPTGISLVMFCQQFGGAVFVSIGQNIFSNELASGLKSVAGIEPSAVVNIGATELKSVVNPANLRAVISAYNGALDKVFIAAAALSCFSIIALPMMEMKNIKPKPGQKGGPPAPAGPKSGDGEQNGAVDVDVEKGDLEDQSTKKDEQQ